MNKTLLVYKVATGGLTVVAAIMSIMAFYHSTANPVVVALDCNGGKSFLAGRREKVNLTDDDVKRFIEEWVRLRYTWNAFDPDKIVKAVAPLSTDGLQEKLKELLGKKTSAPSAAQAQTTSGTAQSTAGNQSLEEDISHVRVLLTDKDAIASFDRILRINGIPLIIPSEVSLQIIQSTPTHWNLAGLFVNGVIEHDEK